MKNLVITLVLPISFITFLGNDAKADTTYVDLDTVANYQISTLYCICA